VRHSKLETLVEGLDHKDMVGILKPTVHIDEFSSKMGDDDEIIVMSFYSRNRQCAHDLVEFFEKGYDFILDADTSPGEIKPNRYLVYVEMRRRSNALEHLHEILDDMRSLTEFKIQEWRIRYDEKYYRFDVENLKDIIPLSPRDYRDKIDKMDREDDLDELRTQANLPVVPKKMKKDKDIDEWKTIAGNHE